MAIKKTLRAKAARVNSKGLRKDRPSTGPQTPDPKAFLHQARLTKKEKQQNKSHEFMTKIGGGHIDGDGGPISKSALRRRKRKANQSLKPKLSDLVDALPDTEPTIEFIESKPTNKPNPKKSRKGASKVENEEKARFAEILKEKNFRQSPFLALRQAIQNQGK